MPSRFLEYLYVALGSATGGMLRHWLAGWITARVDPPLPWGIIIVNVSGSFLIGLLAGWQEVSAGRPWGVLHPLLAVGVLGGYTTFSTFSLQTLRLCQAGEWAGALFNAAFSVLAGVGAAALGWWLGRQGG